MSKKTLKIVTACGLGTGTALFLKTVVEGVCRAHNIPAQVETADATLARALNGSMLDQDNLLHRTIKFF